MKLWDWLTAGPKAAEKVLDGTIAGIDKLVYTDEEKADARAKAMETWLALQKLLGEETTVRSITRRILTFLTVTPFVILILAAAVMYGFDEKYAAFLLALAEGNFGYIVLTIVVFYFGPLVGRIFNKG